MFGHRGAGRPLPVLALAIAGALALAGCGGATASLAPSAPPSVAPTPSPTPAPTPSPSPLDVSAAFMKIVTAPGFSGTATVTGTVTVGATSGDVTGTFAGDADSTSSSLTITAGTFKQVTDKIETGGKHWTRVSPGPWLEDLPKANPSKDLGETLRGLGSVVDLGVESRAGKQLHHLQPKNGGAMTADQAGFDVGDATDGKFTMDFYATDDGMPSVLVLAGSWTQGSGDAAVKNAVELDYTFTAIGQPHTVAPPTDVWVRYTSTVNGYTMAHPADWTVKGAKSKDTYLLGGQPYIYVGLTPYTGTTAAFVTALKKSYAKNFGDPTSEAPTRLGGQTAVRLIYDTKNAAGKPVTLADDAISRNGTGWEVFLVTVSSGASDIELYDTFVATFEFAK